MKNTVQPMLVISGALACLVGMSSRAEAGLITAICDDLACSGGNDFIVLDNSGADNIGATGAINFSASAFGFSLLVSTGQSKPIIGSAAIPQLDLTFSATSSDTSAHSVFLYASDTDFLGAQNFALTLGGTNSGGSGTVTGRAWGGTNNTALSFSGANLLAALAGLSGPTFSGSVSGAYTPAVTPYSLTTGVAITRTTAGTTTGDLNFAATTVPEPASLFLSGLGLIGLAFATYRRKESVRPASWHVWR